MTFSIKKSFKESWNMFFSKKIYIPFVLTSLVSVVGIYIMFGLSVLAGSFLLMKGLWWVLIPLVLIFLFLSAYFILVSVNLPLLTYKTGSVNFKKAFSTVWNYKLITKSVGLFLLIGGGAVIVGYIFSLIFGSINLLVVPLLLAVFVAFIAVRFAFSLYILIESKGGIISSLKKSHEMMKGNGWKFLLFIITVSVVSIIVQIISNQLNVVFPLLSEVVVILFGIAVAPWFSLLTVSPYMQLKK